MSGFTDEDLKRLENILKEKDPYPTLTSEGLKALLTRLEAAEAFAAGAALAHPALKYGPDYKNWMDSKGGAGE